MKKVEGSKNEWVSVSDPSTHGGPFTLTRTKAEGGWTFTVTSPDFKDRDFSSRPEAIKYITVCQKEALKDSSPEAQNDDSDAIEDEELESVD